MAGIQVPVSLQIQNLQSLVSELQSKLSNLKVGSAGFKSVQNLITGIKNEIDKLQVQTSKPFINESQFTKAENSVDKLEDELQRVEITLSRIKFSDLELNPQQKAELKAFEDQINAIKANLKTVKDTAKQDFLGSAMGKVWSENFDSTAITKSFSEITKGIRAEVTKQQNIVNEAKQALNDYQNAMKANDSIEQFLKVKNPLEETNLGAEKYAQIFQETKNGLRFRAGGSTILEEWLKSQLDLDDATIKGLVEGSAQKVKSELEKRLKEIQLANTDVMNKNVSAQTDYTNEKARLEQLNHIMEQLGFSEQSVAVANQALRQQLADTNAAMSDYKDNAVQVVRSNQDVNNTTNAMRTQLDGLRTTLQQTNGEFIRMQRTQQSFNQMKMAVVNFMGFNQVLNLTRNAIRNAISHIRELDSVMNKISIVTDMSTGDLWNQVDAYSKMAQTYGVSIKGAYEVSQIYYQQGLQTNDVLTLTNETLKLAKISGLDYATTTDYMTTAIRGFKMEMSEASRVVDVYSNLAAHTAVSQEELAVAMSKTASSMEAVGATFEEASAMIGTMVAVTRESATNIGSAMKSIASRYGELTKDPTKLVDEEGEAMAFNKVDAALQSVGISMRTVDGQFREFTDVIVELGEKWDQLDSTQQRYIATQFAGNRQQSRFLALVSNVDLLKSNLDVAMNSEDTGTLQALKALDSIEAKTEQVRVAYQQFYTTLGAEDVWKGLLDGAKNVINTLNSLPKLFNKIPLGAIAMIANLVSLIRQVLTTVLSSVASTWQETMTKSGNEAAASGTNVGRTYAQNVKAGIEAETPNVQAAINKMLGGNGIITTNPQANATNAANTMVNTFAKNTQISSNEAERNKQADEYLNNLVKAEEKLGTNFNDGQLNQLLTIGDKIISGDLSSYDAAMQAKNIILGIGQATEQTQTKSQVLFNSLKDGTSKASRGFMGVASVLTTIGLLLNKDTDATRILSGALSGIGGAIQTGTAAVRVFSGDFAALPQLLTGILNIINGFGIAIETPAERLEKLNKTAENLTNISKQEKANYNTLENSLKKLNELQEKRHEGVEAAEEYQTAVDELVEKFPEMIAGFDEAGNIIIDTTDAERILAEAREKSKQATYDAAQAELDASKERRNQARQALKNYNGMPSLAINGDFDLGGQTEEIRGQLLRALGGTINPNETSALRDNIQALEKFYEAYKLNDQSDYQFLEKAKAEDKTLSLDLLQAYLEEQGDNRTEQEQQIYDMFFSMETSTAISARFAETTAQLDTLLKDENASQEDILSAYTELESVFSLAVKSDQFDETDLANARQKIANIGELITTWTKENNIYKGYEKQVVSAWQQSSEADSKAWEVLSQSSTAAAIVTKQIVNIIGDADFNKLKEDAAQTDIWRGYQETMAAFIDSLTPDELSDFERMMNDSANYTTEDFSERFGYKIKNITSFLETWFSDGLTSINERLDEDLLKTSGKTDLGELTGFYDDLNQKRDEVRNNITTTEENYFHQIIDQYDALTDQGLASSANKYGTAALGLFDSINNLNGDLEKTIWKLVSDNGLKTIEGINASIEAINLNSSISQSSKDSIMDFLETIKNTIIPNINLSIQTATSDLLESWSDTSGELSKAMESGLSLQETDKLIAKLESFNISVNLDTDFTQSGDKLILTAEKFTEYWQALANAANTNATDWQSSINTARAILGSMAIGPSSLEGILGNEKDLIALKTIGIDLTDEKYLTQNWSTTLAEIEAAITSSSDGLKRFMWYNETAAKQLAQSWNWEQGNYINSFKDKSGKAIYNPIFNSIDELIAGIAEDLSNPKANKKGTEKRDLLDHLYESYDALISDVLSNGINNINLDNYAGIIKEQKPDIEAALKGSYTDFITAYAQFAGKSISETNDLLVQAIEKDREKVSVDLIKDLQFFNQTQFKTNLSGLNELANKLGKDLGWLIENAVISSNDAIDEYIVDATKIDNLDLSSTEFQNTIQNSIQDFFKSLASYISNALKGNLSSDNARELQEFATNRSIGKLNFIQTADGLKLANDSARKLVAEVEQLDSLQGQVLFEELAENLIETEDAFKSISSTTAYVKDLEKELSQLRAQEETPDNTKRIEALEQELDLAKKINATRATTEDDTFKFMDQKIPSGQNNPLNYWKNWTEAFEKMKATTSGADKGLMAYEDFYNIVTEMGHIAEASGTAIQLGNETLSNSEDAANLIERAAATLSNMSTGDMGVTLSEFGINFSSGVEGMAENVDAGINAIADEQVKMLDSMIQLLETVVAMEELGKIDASGDGILQLGEFLKFDDTGKVIGYAEDYQTWLDDLLVKLHSTDKKYEDLQKGFQLVTADGRTMESIVNKSAEEFDALDAAIMNAFYQAALSNDFSEENIFESIKNVFASLQWDDSGKWHEITVGDLKLSVKSGAVLQWDSDGNAIINGQSTSIKDADKAWKATLESEFTDILGKETEITTDGVKYHSNIEATVEVDAENKYLVTFNDGTTIEADSKESAKFAIATYTKMTGQDLETKDNAAETMHFTIHQKGKADLVFTLENGEVDVQTQGSGDGAGITEAKNAAQTVANEKAAEVAQSIDGTTGHATIDNMTLELSEKATIKLGASDVTLSDNISSVSATADELVISVNPDGYSLAEDSVVNIKDINAIGTATNLQVTVEPGVTNMTVTTSDEEGSLIADEIPVINVTAQQLNVTEYDEATLPTEITITPTVNDEEANKKIDALTQLLGDVEVIDPSIEVTVKDETKDGIQSVLDSLAKIPTSKTTTIYVKEQGIGDSKGTIGGGGRNNYTSTRNEIKATGNVANAKGTLMGELGPELVVQNGRYFVAGQNGAEFVDLMDDAIVFNHLQTQQLLKNGMSNSRGRALTNERVATAYAQGNVNGGPAMASASAALSALKQLRAMWQSLQKMGSKDLLGAGGGGGGGGGGSDDMGTFLKDLERWYNWLQRIEQLEKEINYQEQLRAKIESDMIPHGQDYFNSQLVTLGKLEDQIAVRQDLLNSQQEYFNARRAELNTKSPFSSLYTFDETGQLKYREGAFGTLSEILSADEYGQPKYTPEEQYNKIVALNPDFANYMKYDTEGKEIEWTDDQGQPNTEAYTTALEAFFDKIDADKEEMQSLHDSIEDLNIDILENDESINEILHNIEENQIDVENKVLAAIEDSRQREIDKLQDTRDAIEDSSNKLIQGLQDQLDNERKMYESQANSDELTRLQRQLAILQRSGASSADISNLQSQITDKQYDMYFDTQEQQIEAIQQASDAEIEKLDAQIGLMTETLAYEKENGLLWNDVYDIMHGKSPEGIAQFIRNNDSSLWGESPTEQIKTDRENLFKIAQWTEFSSKFDGLQTLVEYFTKTEVGTENLDTEAKKEADVINGLATKNASADTQAEATAALSTTTANQTSNNTNTNNANQTQKSNGKYKVSYYFTTNEGERVSGFGVGSTPTEAKNAAAILAERKRSSYTNADKVKYGQAVQYERGGMVKEDGEGYLHADEGVLTAEQTSTLRNEILGNKPNSLLSLLMTWKDSVTGLADTSSISNYNDGVTIEKAEVIMQVSQIANDYDAQRAGEQALDKIMSIARKTMAQNRIGR